MEVRGVPASRCSGTLLSPTIVLTAGHCTNNFPGSLYMVVFPGFTGDFSLLLSNNHSTGGTCFGDSGGPNFLGDSQVVAGVTSLGLDGNCAGTGGVFRIDRRNVLDFVGPYLA